MNEIIKDKLYLGDMFDANDKDEIKKKNISCIVCVADNLQIGTWGYVPAVPDYQKGW